MRNAALHPLGKKTRTPRRVSLKRSDKACGRRFSVCSYCRQFRGDDGDWHPLSLLGMETPDLRISHGICPACAEALYPELYEAVLAKRVLV